MTTFSYSTDAPATVRAGVLVLPVFQSTNGPVAGPGVKEVGLEQAYRDAKLTGKKQENLLVVRRDGDRFAAGAVLLVGVGPKAEADAERAPARPRARVAGVRPRSGPPRRRSRRRHRKGPSTPCRRPSRASSSALPVRPLQDRGVRESRSPASRCSARHAATPRRRARPSRRGQVVAEAVCWARDLVNTPAGDMPPAQIAREAQKMARAVGLRCKVWGKPELEKGGFGGILGVGAGSVNPPRLIELWYKGAGTETPIALTGKGIAFDSGGLSIKDAKGMETMKCDMGGAASILATMRVIALLKPKINVIAAIPSSENMPSGSATKPGDVLTHRGGTTSEVLNTDAEGRLVLADALAYLAEKKPKVIIDTATLTGACMIALGDQITGAMGNDDGAVP